MLHWYLPAAPAILMGACRWLGIDAEFLDFNAKEHTAQQVIDLNPDLIVLSLFSYKSQEPARELAKEIKKLNSSAKITIGGAGIKNSINDTLEHNISALLEQGIIDYYQDGDGEYQFPEFLARFFDLPAIDKFVDMDTPYTPDYSKYDVAFYQRAAETAKLKLWVPITGSRGCVRRCTFCEIHEHWKFTQRSPANIVLEMREVLKDLQSVHFHFTDSLVNGSLPAFEILLDLIIELRKEYPTFTWGGQFIVRNAKQCDDTYWKRIATSGAELLEIGVETGSDRLRYEMKKNFLNEDLDSSLEFMSKYSITCAFLMFTGYPTETEDDFAETLAMLTKYQPYANKVINYLELGYLTSVLPGTPLYSESKKDKTMILTKDVHVWYNKSNPPLTFANRLARRKQLEMHASSNGYTLAWDTHSQVEEAELVYKNNYKIINLIEKQ